MSILNQPQFHDEEAAFSFLEDALWGDKPHCPHCGCTDRLTKIKANPKKRVRYGLWRCGDCKKQFTAKVGTVFEHARIPMHKILQAVFLMCASKKGISAHQLHRILEVSYPTAWFLEHRIREAMRCGGLAPMGIGGGEVEVDETFVGPSKQSKRTRIKKGRGPAHMTAVLSLIDRRTGRAQSMAVKNLKAQTLYPIIRENVDREARLMTDDARHYKTIGKEFAYHSVVRHKIGQYVKRQDRTIHTQTIEGFFSIFKRGMRGVYQHCSKKHLHRYLAEFDFRYSHRVALGYDDMARFGATLGGIMGKRLTYRDSSTW